MLDDPRLQVAAARAGAPSAEAAISATADTPGVHAPSASGAQARQLHLAPVPSGATVPFVALQRQNLAVPRPGWLFKLFRASHPPIGERVDFMNTYRPWAHGERERYIGHFRR